MFAMRLAVAAFGIALCFAIQFLLRKLERRTLWKRLVAIAIIVPIAAEMYAWVCYFGVAWVEGDPLIPTIQWGRAIMTLATWSWFFVGWVGLSLAVEYAFDAREEELRASRFWPW